MAAGLAADQAVKLATAPLPGIVGDVASVVVDQAVDGFKPEDTAGQKGNDLINTISGRQGLEANHLIVSSLEQAGRLPADVPDRDAVTDGSGHLSPLESFRDGNPDPDVTASDTPPDQALANIARHGPTGSPDWEAAVGRYHDAVADSLGVLDPDHANPEPRAELDSEEVDRLQGKERVPWGFM